MNKRLIAFSVIPLVTIVAYYLAFNTSTSFDLYAYYTKDVELHYSVSDKIEDSEASSKLDPNCFASPNLGKSYVGFKEAVAFKESRGDYFIVNTLGYLGKYQFGKGTLKLIGINNSNEFLNRPELQEKAFLANAMRNKWILRRDIKRFVGQHIDGVLVTESGILAAAHLAGPGSVKRYLRSYGAIGFTDAYGTTVRNYMKKFSGYDTSFIKADKKAKVSFL